MHPTTPFIRRFFFASLFAYAMLAVPLYAVAQHLREGPLPPDNRYCVVDANGHLSIDGERVRFWGTIGNFPGKQETIDGDIYARQRLMVQRIKAMGFNMIRLWNFADPDVEYVKGDGSPNDIADFFIAECKREGIRIWGGGIGSVALYEDDLPEIAADIPDTPTREEWMEAVRGQMRNYYWSGGQPALSLRYGMVVWDPLLEKALIERMAATADHFNQHTGLRYADDPVFSVWELSNEQWWTRRMSGGQWQEYPDYFRESLLHGWHAFLREKYGDRKNLEEAWGFLLPGENLDNESILFLPMAKPTAGELNDASEVAAEALTVLKQPYSRDDFTRQRGSDVMEYFLTLLVGHKQRVAEAFKTFGKSTRLSPLLFDTGIGFNAQSAYLHQLADAVSHNAYMEGVETRRLDPESRRYPFYSGLDRPPQMAKDVPWLEHNKMPGKPFLAYETQLGSPTPYRAEWPMRLAALALIQDWDAVAWHYWGANEYDFTSERPFDGKLSYPASGAYQYHYTFDEVEMSAMKAAGMLFRYGGVQPAPDPTVYRFGRPALYDPASMDYAGSYGDIGWNMLPTTYRYGVRLIIDPEQEEFVKVEGPQLRFNGFENPNPIRPTDEIEFDYQYAHLKIDAPGVASYTGFFAQYPGERIEFPKAGLSLGDIEHQSPSNAPYPHSEDERFFVFTCTSADGRPLAEADKALISLVASSTNTGLKISADKEEVDYGRAPVLVTRVGATLAGDALTGMHYRIRDFHLNTLAEGIIEDGRLRIPAELPVFDIQLNRIAD